MASTTIFNRRVPPPGPRGTFADFCPLWRFTMVPPLPAPDNATHINPGCVHSPNTLPIDHSFCNLKYVCFFFQSPVCFVVAFIFRSKSSPSSPRCVKETNSHALHETLNYTRPDTWHETQVAVARSQANFWHDTEIHACLPTSPSSKYQHYTCKA